MKKLVLMAVALLMLGFASCEKRDFDPNDPNFYCFKITVTVSAPELTKPVSVVAYAWDNGAGAQAAADLYEKQIKEQMKIEGITTKVDIEKSSYTTEAVCNEHSTPVVVK